MITRIAVVAVLACSLAPLWAATAPDNHAKMHHAAEWEGTITLTNKQTFKQKMDEGTVTLTTNRTITYRVFLNERQRHLLAKEYEIARWSSDPMNTSVRGGANDRYVQTFGEDVPPLQESLTANLASPGERGTAYLAIDPQRKTYSVVVNPLYADAVIEAYEEKKVDEGGFATPCLSVEGMPLPTGGTTLSGTKALPHEYTASIAHGVTEEITYTMSWNLRPAGPPPELTIDPESFRDYVPKNDTGSVRIFSKKPDTAPALVRVYLSAISREPGTCLNSKEDGTEEDLAFDPAANSAFNAPTKVGDEWMIETKEEVREVRVAIAARDYGAYGKLRAEAKVRGKWTPIKMDGGGQTIINYPLDQNNNHVADAWEKQEGILGKNLPASWDGETQPALNGKAGDGLTLYEEYRGLIVQGNHQRLSPARKKLVIECHVPQAKNGIALFGSATGLQILTVQPGELKANPTDGSDTTVVNGNHGTGHGGLQHGVRIVAGAAAGQGPAVVGGETIQRNSRAKVIHSPGEVLEVQVSGSIAQDMAEFGEAAVNRDVAHELGHALGARHHGDAAAPLVERDLGESYVPPRFTVYGSDGVLYTKRPLRISGAIGVKGNEISGDVGCIMAYTGVFAWALHTDGRNYTFFNVGETAPGTRFCTSPVGTGINAPQHKPAPLFGDAAAGRGNCLGAMQVRDY